MKIETIGIIGQGFVGTAVKEGMSKYYRIHTYDKFSNEFDEYIYDLVQLI